MLLCYNKYTESSRYNYVENVSAEVSLSVNPEMVKEIEDHLTVVIFKERILMQINLFQR